MDSLFISELTRLNIYIMEAPGRHVFSIGDSQAYFSVALIGRGSFALTNRIVLRQQLLGKHEVSGGTGPSDEPRARTSERIIAAVAPRLLGKVALCFQSRLARPLVIRALSNCRQF